jgi:glycosyltransferase involved in cell wall biosynthesis
VVVTSDEEVERFRRTYRWRPEAIASAISVPAEAADPRAAGRAVVWVGDHTYAANVRGLLRFLREGWRPLGEGGAVLRVAGRHPPAELLRLAEELPGIEVLGFVEHLDALLSRCAAAVVPLWDGAGIKMKTLALMGAGLPVAATPVGVEGLAVRDGVHARVAATPGGLADALVELLDDRAVAAAVGKRGREFILRNHTWSGLVPRYERLLERAAGRV